MDGVSLAVVVALLAVFIPMVAEALRSSANERVLRAAGAVEPAGDVYALMQWSYPGAFLVMAVVAVRAGVTHLDTLGVAIFVLAKALKYWAISTLGTRWSFRVLVPPQSARVTTGPYRWIPHPNYVAVAGELIGFMTMLHAGGVGALAVLWFILLMRLRVRVEERALAG